MGWIRKLARLINTARLIITNIIFFVLLAILVGVLVSDKSAEPLSINTTLVIQPSGELKDLDDTNTFFSQFFQDAEDGETISVESIVNLLNYAREDPRINSVLLNLDQNPQISVRQARRIGLELSRFKESGKSVFAYGINFTQGQYLLASFADKLFQHPQGQFVPTGYSITSSYYTKLIESLGITINVFRIGKYKEAIEPFTLNAMSEDSRNSNRILVTSLWHQYIDLVATNRLLTFQEIENYTSNFISLLEANNGDSAALAVKSGLVDELISPIDIHRNMALQLDLAEGADLKEISHAHYSSIIQNEADLVIPRETIALIHATGPIVYGGNAPSNISAQSFVKLVDSAVDDSEIKALVIRINSPGGSALASELIRETLGNMQSAGKPVVISMGDIAASGGYLIASTADRILAEPDTLTGSIGIFGILPTIDKSLEKIGVNTDGVGTTMLSSSFDPRYPLNDAGKALITVSINRGYTQFVDLVSKGRNLEKQKAESLATGQVWTGYDAMELGLVDEIGTMKDAIDKAAELASLTDYSIKVLENRSSSANLLARFMNRISHRSALAQTIKDIEFLRDGLDDPSHTYALCIWCDLLE